MGCNFPRSWFVRFNPKLLAIPLTRSLWRSIPERSATSTRATQGKLNDTQSVLADTQVKLTETQRKLTDLTEQVCRRELTTGKRGMIPRVR